jgi:hypothetical protein
MSKGICAHCDEPVAHPKSAYCVEHRKEYGRLRYARLHGKARPQPWAKQEIKLVAVPLKELEQVRKYCLKTYGSLDCVSSSCENSIDFKSGYCYDHQYEWLTRAGFKVT